LIDLASVVQPKRNRAHHVLRIKHLHNKCIIRGSIKTRVLWDLPLTVSLAVLLEHNFFTDDYAPTLRMEGSKWIKRIEFMPKNKFRILGGRGYSAGVPLAE
jgi:hypothetical protein